jgi:hypothetical protein
MRKHLVVSCALAVVVLAASAAPAFTEDNIGTVSIAVATPAPSGPCLTVAPGKVDFGTLPFTIPGTGGLSRGTSGTLTVTQCGTVGQNLNVSATDASGASGSWTIQRSGGVNPCPTVDVFHLEFDPAQSGARWLGTFIDGTPRALFDTAFQPVVFAPGTAELATMTIFMPCQGSNGAGEPKTLSATLTAVVA